MNSSAMQIKINYLDLFDYSLDFLFIIDLSGNILDVNKVAAKTLGYSKKEILSKNITDIIVEEVVDPILVRKKELLDIGRISRYNIYALEKKNGERIYLESHGIPLRENGEIHTILGIGHEITEIIKAERLLKASEIKYKNLFSQSPYSISIFDSNGNLIESNRNIFYKLAEYAEEDFTGKNFIEIIKHFNNSEQLIKIFSARLKSIRGGKTPDPIDFPVITKSGRIIWLNWQSSTIKINNETFIQVIIQDITDKKESEEKFRTLFKYSTSGIAYHKLTYDSEGIPNNYIITDINPQYENILPLKREDVINKRATEAYNVENAPYIDTYSTVAETQESISFEDYFEPLDKNFRISVISQRKGEFITVFDDISEYKKAEYKLKEQSEKLSWLNTIINLGNESTNLQEFLEKSYDQVLDIVGFDRGGVYLFNPETHHNKLVLYKNVHPDFIAAVEDVDISEGLFNKVFDKNKPFYIEDFSDFMKGSKELGVYSAVIVPLRSKDQYVGSMNIGSPVHQVLSPNELELLVAIGKQMGIIIQKFESEKLLKKSEEKFRKLSYELEEIVNERTKELKQSEEKYRELFNGMSNGVAVYETLDEGNTFFFKDMNPSGEKISGVKRNDIIGNDVLDLFPKVKTTGLIDTFKTVYKSNTPIRHPIAFYGDETISRWAENYVYKLPTGEIVAVYDDLTVLKITEQKLKQLNEKLEQKVDERTKELKESEEKFRTLAEQSLLGIGILQDYDLKYVNKRLAKLFGYTIEEMKRIEFSDFLQSIHPEDREKVAKQVERRKDRTQDTITYYQFRAYKKTGQLFWVEIFSKIIEYQGNRASLITFLDITDIKVAEKELKESEEKFRNITEQSFMGIIIVQNGQLKYLNKAMSKITGYPVEEMLNWSEKDMMKLIDPEDLDIVVKRLQSNVEMTMAPFSNNSFRVINKNGEMRWLEDYTTKIIYQGEPANLISMVDITDKKEAEQLIIEENRRLLELHDLRKDLITRVSHELKTPMTSIYGANQIITKLYMDQIGEEAQKYIEIGNRGCLRLKQLIDNLLDVSRLNAKRLELHLQKENLIDLIIDCVKDMNYLATNRQLKMKFDLPNEAYLNIDRLRFRQVLTNIISNAIKNTPKDGEIYINLVEKSDFININIKDTGVGLTEKEMEKLFEKFGKIERYGMDLGVDIEGSGLGLYISKEIVELHGGQIFVESEGRNKGAIFTIRLFKN